MDGAGHPINKKGYLVDKKGNILDRQGRVMWKKNNLSEDGEPPKIFNFSKFNPD